MFSLAIFVLGFIACAAIIVYSGARLSFYGDRIAELTGMGRAWVGLILMASVTSLPELITGISAVAIVKAPDLAAGDIFGSCAFNLLILSFLDARIKKPLFSLVKSSHIVAAIFGIILAAMAGMAIFLAQETPALLWISSFTFLLFGMYLAAVWGIYQYDKLGDAEQINSTPITSPGRNEEFKKVRRGYILNALVVVGVAIFLPYFGEHIAAQTGLDNSFFGTLFIAATTSLPELVVSLVALRIGALDIAVGNLLGSNVFNMFILGVDDVFYSDGSLFRVISPSHLLSVLFTIIMTAVVGLGILFKPQKKHFWLLGLDSFVIIVCYVLLMTYLFFKS